jgi:glucokinase
MHVFGAAKEGDLLALVIVGEVARLLAAALADLANLVDPALFVITGGVAQAGEDLRGRVEQELSVTATVGSEPPPPVVLGTLGGDAGMMGGAALALSGTTF